MYLREQERKRERRKETNTGRGASLGELTGLQPPPSFWPHSQQAKLESGYKAAAEPGQES